MTGLFPRNFDPVVESRGPAIWFERVKHTIIRGSHISGRYTGRRENPFRGFWCLLCYFNTGVYAVGYQY